MAEDLGERTEEPTPRRLHEARREGNIARSQELSGAVMLLAGTLLAAAAMLPVLYRMRDVMEAALGDDRLGDATRPEHVRAVVAFVAGAGARIAAPLLLIVTAAAAVVQLGQVGPLFSPRLVRPRFGQLSPLHGLRRLVGAHNAFKALLSLVKLAAVLAIAALTVYEHRFEVAGLGLLEPVQGLRRAGLMVLDLALRLAAVLLALGAADFLFQKWKHRRDLRMTRQQVRDEMRQTEGDPHVKRRRARMAQQIAMQRIRSAVPRADVVITNPQHFSVAIRYDADRMGAPTVTAKGADFLALRIRQIALVHGVPLVQRPPLARSLYREVPVGRQIPPDLYHAVAGVLADVYRLREGRVAS